MQVLMAFVKQLAMEIVKMQSSADSYLSDGGVSASPSTGEQHICCHTFPTMFVTDTFTIQLLVGLLAESQQKPGYNYQLSADLNGIL